MERLTFEKLLRAFDNADHDTITQTFTENATWEILGHWTMKGKDEIRKFFAASDISVVESRRERVLFTDSYAVWRAKENAVMLLVRNGKTGAAMFMI